MSKKEQQEISTTVLAKELGIPSRELFKLLKNLGWMKRGNDGWLLTTKGEFEGGSYVNSEKYGRYVVWSRAVLQHKSIRDLPQQLVISASSLGKEFAVSGRYINHVLAELGWLTPGVKGWRLTPVGEALGGVQIEDEETSVPYVKWPLALTENPALKCALVNAYGSVERSAGDCCAGIDGHKFDSALEASICNWLYYAGITHACGRRLPTEQELYADFYLPSGNIYIEYWGEKGGAGLLSNKMARKKLYEEQGWKVIELSPSDIASLDDVMPRELLKHGVTVY